MRIVLFLLIIFRPCMECVCLDIKNKTTIFHVTFSKAHIDDEHNVLFISFSHEKVVWFDVSMKKMSLMQVFNSFKKLLSQHEYSFYRESFIPFNEQIFSAS